MPRITVITAAYNRANVMARTIDSALLQNYQDYEYLLLDDGSTDDLESLVSRYQNAKLRYVKQSNAGFVNAMIRSVRESDSEYIAVLGSGDEALPDRLHEQVRVLDANPDIAAVGSFITRVGPNGRYTEYSRPTFRGNPREALIEGSVFSHTEVMFRRSAYEQVGGYRAFFTYSQDNDLWLRMSEHWDLAVVPMNLTRTYKLQDGITVVPSKLSQARIFRDFAVYCALSRRAGRGDPLSMHGASAALFRPRSKRLARTLAVDALKLISRQDPAAREIASMSLMEKITLHGIAAAVGARTGYSPTTRWIFPAIKMVKRGRAI